MLDVIYVILYVVICRSSTIYYTPNSGKELYMVACGNARNIKELSRKFGISVQTLRSYQQKKIVACHDISGTDGKTQLFDKDCVAIRLVLKNKIRIHDPSLNLTSVGRVLTKVCGQRDTKLIRALRTKRKDQVVRELLTKAIELGMLV